MKDSKMTGDELPPLAFVDAVEELSMFPIISTQLLFFCLVFSVLIDDPLILFKEDNLRLRFGSMKVGIFEGLLQRMELSPY